MGIDLVQKFKEGGPLMWPILFCSILSVLFTIERLIVIIIQKFKLSPKKFARVLEELFKKHQGNKDKIVDEALAICEKKGGVAGAIFSEGLLKYKQAKKIKMSVPEMKGWLTTAIEERARVELPQLESHLGVISTSATVSPLIGLLGTVQGMIMSFDKMASAAGGAKPDELAGGIAVALLTTVGGLIVAIPSLVFFNAIKGYIEAYVMRIEEAAIALIDTLILEGTDTQ